ncbi:hypothetical protein [Paenibacillus tundrae]|nr:hypothetical protein [Paenibacillus tundrae]
MSTFDMARVGTCWMRMDETSIPEVLNYVAPQGSHLETVYPLW